EPSSCHTTCTFIHHPSLVDEGSHRICALVDDGWAFKGWEGDCANWPKNCYDLFFQGDYSCRAVFERAADHPCGATGQTCCGGTGCDAGAYCSAGWCEPCGDPDEPCCNGQCNAGAVCIGDRVASFCSKCGGQSDYCCSDRSCNDGLKCDGNGF